MTRRFFIFLLVALFGWSLTSGLVAEDAASRIKARLTALDTLKAAGKVGEDNQGLVAARGAVSAEERALIAAENSDRNELYGIVAQRSGQSVEAVGQQRALRIAQIAAAGVWLQDGRGRWYQKP